MVNYSGNSTKSLYLSVEASLKKFRTTYIDILYASHSLLGAFSVAERSAPTPKKPDAGRAARKAA